MRFSLLLDFIYDASGRPFALTCTNGTAEPATYYYVLNLQGDVVGLIDENADFVAKYTYNAWGEILSITDADGNASTSATHIANINPLRYRGYYYDTETGFYYLQSRYYDPAMHRFINADSLASTGQGILGTNMFAYCLNNPVRRIDVSGTYSIGDIWEDFCDEIEDTVEGVCDAVSDAWEWSCGAAEDAWDWTCGAVEDAWGWTCGAVEDAWGWTCGAAEDVWDWTCDTATSLWDWTCDTATSLWDWTCDTASDIGDWITDVIVDINWNYILKEMLTNTVSGAVAGAATGAISGKLGAPFTAGLSIPACAVVCGIIGGVGGAIEGFIEAFIEEIS